MHDRLHHIFPLFSTFSFISGCHKLCTVAAFQLPAKHTTNNNRIQFILLLSQWGVIADAAQVCLPPPQPHHRPRLATYPHRLNEAGESSGRTYSAAGMCWLGCMASGVGAAVTDVSRGSQAAGMQDPTARWSLVETRQVQLVRRSLLHSDLLQLSSGCSGWFHHAVFFNIVNILC